MLRLSRWSIFLGLTILAGCGGGGGSIANNPKQGTPSNVVDLVVGPGPPATMGGAFNIPQVTVTVCQPGTSTCAMITNVLVDTGSAGFRVLASALADAGLTLPDLTDPSNPQNTIAECIPFIDGYTWGPLATAKVQVGAETASSVSINIINDNGAYTPTVPSGCTTLTSGKSLNSVQAFSANGVLGVGVFVQDCGPTCANCQLAGGGCTPTNDIYYSCNTASSTCTPVPIPLTTQVQNPAALFATDNNGVIVQLPSIAASGTPSATGSLIFGIGTQSNNALGTATVLTTNNAGYITTTFNGQFLPNSFIDSGSNAYYFADSSIPTCSTASGFYCPSSTLSLPVTNQAEDANSNVTGVTSNVTIQIADLNSISNTNFAINDVGGTAASSTGTNTLSNDFDFGVPFFYGRRVYTAIEGLKAGSATGPYFAY
jgi:hypothetical protein